MPSVTSLALLALSAVGSMARPAKRTNDDYNNCMTFADANHVAYLYGQLIANYSNSSADAILSTNFTDYSESVNSLIDECPQGAAAISLPLLAPTFTSRKQFEIGQGQQPAINFNQLNIWPACNTVIIRWQTTNTANITAVKPVNGLIVMETVPAPADSENPYLIDTVYSEFDSAAWLQNLKDAGICAAVSASASSTPAAPTPTPASASSSSAAVTPTPAGPSSAAGPPSATITSAPVVETTINGAVTWVTVTDVDYTTEVTYATTTVWS